MPRILKTASCAIAAMLCPTALLASDVRPTLQEYREWTGYGPSYGFMCKVTFTGPGLTIRAAPGGRSIAPVRRGQKFGLHDVRVTRDGKLWYRNGVAAFAPVGWFPSESVECDAEHFD